MHAPESRSINQCTYTPIVNDPAVGDDKPGFVAFRGLLKRGLLSVAFDDPRLSRVILKRLVESDGELWSLHRTELATAVDQIWQGDVTASARILAAVDAPEVAAFAERALQVKRDLLSAAEGHVEQAIVTLAAQDGASENDLAAVRSDLAAMRASIVAEVRELIPAAVASLREAATTSHPHVAGDGTPRRAASATGEGAPGEAPGIATSGPAGTPTATTRGATARVPAGATTASATVTTHTTGADGAGATLSGTVTQPMMSAVTTPRLTAISREAVRAELTRRFPETAELLTAMDVFAIPLTSEPAAMAEIGDVVMVAPVQGFIAQQQQKTLRTLVESLKIEPVGYLHLERLQFTPVGYVRGELVYSLPLLPHETVRLSHREWSRSESEFASLVSTSLETATEEALSEKSELTQSFNSQEQHSSAFNASVTASGGYGPVQISTSVGYNSANAETQSRQFAVKRAQEITRKSSSRAKKDHKISFKVTTTYEVEDQSYREITNEFDRAVRWDFHRLMKKWRIDLYRYDVRLTYDVFVPEPGSYLLRQYIWLKALEKALAQEWKLSFGPADIARSGPMSWEALATAYSVALDPPPLDPYYQTFHADVAFSQQHSGRAVLPVTLPEGYEIEWLHGRGDERYDLRQSDDTWWSELVGTVDALAYHNTVRLNAGLGHSNQFLWEYEYEWKWWAKQGMAMSVTVDAKARPTAQRFQEWQMQCYERLVDAAKARYEARYQRLKAERDALLAELAQDDALSLRKLEKEEVMKAVLRWILGPEFSFYPHNLLGLPELSLAKDGSLEYYDPTTQSVKQAYWEPVHKHGELVKFLHHAIEWENVSYVLYPYFWTDEPRWDFKQALYHGDYVHRSFLRAGAARVVLTIRPGYERRFLSFMEGSFEKILDQHEYMTVADELENMAKEKYPYTPDANEEKEEYLFSWDRVPGDESARLLRSLRRDFHVEWAENGSVEKAGEGKVITVTSGEGRAKATVVIALDEAKHVATLTIADGRTYELTVKEGDGACEVYRTANLVDTWYEFTPTGALDVVEGSVIA